MRRDRGFDRLVNFSDAVVAIAITLLVLPLVDTAANLGTRAPADLLAANSQKLLMFAISFVVIGRFWLSHHRMFEFVDGYTPLVLWVNLYWLLTIVFIPFPTELIASSGYDDPVTCGLYIGTMTLTSLTGLLQQYIFVRNPQLQREEVRGTLKLAPWVFTAALMIVALVLSLTVPHLGLWALVLLALGRPLGTLFDRRRKTSATGSAAA